MVYPLMGLKAVVCDVNETLFALEAFRPRLAAAGLTQDNSLEVRVLSFDLLLHHHPQLACGTCDDYAHACFRRASHFMQ